MEEGKSKQSKVLIGVILGLLIAVFVAGYFIYDFKNQRDEIFEENLLSKEQLEDEYESMSMEYEKFKINLKNDSLLLKLDNEQVRVQRLLEELKTVKSENKAEISRLNKELSSLRKILKHYVAQIDSLNKANEQLRKENKEITTRYQQTARTLNQVSKEKESLSEKVGMAAKLNATRINAVAANSKGKAQKNIKKVEQIIVSFTIERNVTAEPGEREVFVRIMKPDDDVLIKSSANLFPFENTQMNYSMKRVIEYGGEEVDIVLYWAVEEFLMAGEYRVDVFADGGRIGSRKFTIGQ